MRFVGVGEAIGVHGNVRVRLVLEIRRERAGRREAVVSELVVRETYGACHCFSASYRTGGVLGWARWCSFLSLCIMGEWNWGGPRRRRRASR